MLQPCAHLRYSHFAFPTADGCRVVVAAVVAGVDESQVVLAVGFAAVLNTDLSVVLVVAVQVQGGTAWDSVCLPQLTCLAQHHCRVS